MTERCFEGRTAQVRGSARGIGRADQVLCEAWAPHDIRVNAVAPGLIENEMIAGAEPELIEKLVAETPMGRIGVSAHRPLVVCGGRVMV